MEVMFIQGRSGSVALFLWNVVLASAARRVAEGAAVRSAERKALFLSIVVDIVAFGTSGLDLLKLCN